MTSLRAEVVVASNRAASGVYEDQTGPLIVSFLQGLGFTVDAPVVVPDGEPVGAAIAAAASGGARLVLTTGGTGLTPTDRTPEETRGLLDFEVPGIADAIRAAGVDAGVPTAVLSRGVAGVVGDCLVVNLPGSAAGSRTGWPCSSRSCSTPSSRSWGATIEAVAGPAARRRGHAAPAQVLRPGRLAVGARAQRGLAGPVGRHGPARGGEPAGHLPPAGPPAARAGAGRVRRTPSRSRSPAPSPAR